MGQELELAAGEVPLGVPEEAVLRGELLGKLGLEPVELAAKLAILIQGRPELAAGFFHLPAHLLQVGPGLLPRPLDLGLRGGDQLLRIGLRFQRRLELGELAHQVLQEMLVGIRLLEGTHACGPDRPQPFDAPPGAELGRPELLRRLLGLALDLSCPGLRFSLPD